MLLVRDDVMHLKPERSLRALHHLPQIAEDRIAAAVLARHRARARDTKDDVLREHLAQYLRIAFRERGIRLAHEVFVWMHQRPLLLPRPGRGDEWPLRFRSGL